MEVIAVILMIVFALISASDRKKKAANQQKGAQAGARKAEKGRPVSQMSISERQARLNELRQKKAERANRNAEAADDFIPVMPSNAEAAFESSLSELRDLLNVAAQARPAEGESMLEDADCVGGSMPHNHAEGASILEDEDCAGGSMAHSHTQGVSRAAQRQRLSDLDHGRETETEARLVPEAIDAHALRRAVVMAEVLGKPRGMKRRQYSA